MKKPYTRTRFKLKYSQRGQSMIEYTVVVTFGILFMTTGPMKSAIEDVTEAMQSNYQGYTYAISFSDLPDSDSVSEYRTLLESQSEDPNHPKTKELIAKLTQHEPLAYQSEIKTYNIPPLNFVSILQQAIYNLAGITIPP